MPLPIINPSAMRVRHYMVSFTQKNNDEHKFVDEKEIAEGITFRPNRVMTLVTEPGQMTIDGIIVDGQNQLLATVDAYDWSMKHYEEVHRTFLAEHGLANKTPEEVDAYLDTREYSMPDPCRVDLPAVQAGAKIRVTGRFGNVPGDFNFVLTLQGPAMGETGA